MTSRPNIIIIILDALRARNVSSYGYKSLTTPYLDDLAQHNILFRRAFAPGTWTIPTHISMLTGLYLSQHRIENVKANRKLNHTIVNLPAVLNSHGYRTAAFSQNQLFSPEHNFDYFSEFFSSETIFDNQSRPPNTKELGKMGRIRDTFVRYRRKKKGSQLMFDKVLKWIDKNLDLPFLAFVNITDVHYAWAVNPLSLLSHFGFRLGQLTNSEFYDPKPFEFNSGQHVITDNHRETWEFLYNEATKQIDREVGKFLDRLNRPAASNTIIVITSDHGEMLGDGRDIFGHTLSLHDNLLHVPLLIRHPDIVSPVTVEGVVQTLDLYSSIIDWCGLSTDNIPLAQLQRPSLSLAIESPGQKSGYAFAEEDFTDSYDPRETLVRLNPNLDPALYPQQQIAIRSTDHKFIWRSDHKHEFYDMVKDPEEAQNLIDDYASASIQQELQSELQMWRQNLEIFPPISLEQDITTDPEVEERLKALGYLG